MNRHPSDPPFKRCKVLATSLGRQGAWVRHAWELSAWRGLGWEKKEWPGRWSLKSSGRGQTGKGTEVISFIQKHLLSTYCVPASGRMVHGADDKHQKQASGLKQKGTERRWGWGGEGTPEGVYAAI